MASFQESARASSYDSTDTMWSKRLKCPVHINYNGKHFPLEKNAMTEPGLVLETSSSIGLYRLVDYKL